MSSAKSPPVSPLAPRTRPDLPPIRGVGLATAQAGIRYSGRTDVLYVALAEGTQAAGVFTRSKCPSAPVDWCRAALGSAGARALVVNSGNANAFTGQRGREAVERTAAIAAEAAGGRPEEIFIASTGVIGEPLDATKFQGVLADCAGRTEPGPEAWAAAAQAIMTTDTFPKLATRRAAIDGVPVTPQRHRQGRRHDRPRHGDDAELRVHRRRPAPGRAPDAAQRRHGHELQLRHGRRRHLHIRHADAVRHGGGRQRRGLRSR